jgi:hypothetical protein
MSTTIRRITPLALCVFAFAGPVSAQSRDPLPDVRARLKIESQHVEKEIHDGRMRAYRLLRTDPNGAYDIIKGLIGMLRKDTSLSEEKNKSLTKTLQSDIENLRALASVRRTSETARGTRIEMRRTPAPRVEAAGKSAYDTAASRIRSMSGHVIEARKVRDKSGDRFAGAIAQVDQSAVLPASDYDLPPDWLEKSKKRSPEAKLTAKEKALLEALKKLVPVDYNMATFQSVLDDLSKKLGGQTILIDKQALEEANVTYDTPITLRFNKPVSARTALKKVLADVGLTYVIRKETIEVTTVARAREMLTTRTYYLGDLVGVGNPLLPAVANQFQMIQAIGTIINQIQGIDPESWEGRGGPGTISFDPVRMALIIRQSAEMHYMLNGMR